VSDTYTKLFRSIAASTIVSEPLATRWLWVTLLSQCDRTGTVYGSVPGLARMANISLAEVEDALQRLHAPDPYSRTKDHEGRRLETVDGGWRLLNYAKYDAMRNEAERREAKREWDRKHRPSGWKRVKGSESDSPEQSDDSPTVRQESDETRQSGPMSHVSCPMSQGKAESAIADLPPAAPSGPTLSLVPEPESRQPCPQQRIVALYHECLPELRRVREWNETRQRLLARRWAEDPERQDLEWWRGFFGYVRRSPFLMGRVTGRDGRPFDCDLEWLIRPTNFAKVVEGKYEDAA
jgi:hypothetical protein